MEQPIYRFVEVSPDGKRSRILATGKADIVMRSLYEDEAKKNKEVASIDYEVYLQSFKNGLKSLGRNGVNDILFELAELSDEDLSLMLVFINGGNVWVDKYQPLMQEYNSSPKGVNFILNKVSHRSFFLMNYLASRVSTLQDK